MNILINQKKEVIKYLNDDNDNIDEYCKVESYFINSYDFIKEKEKNNYKELLEKYDKDGDNKYSYFTHTGVKVDEVSEILIYI